MPALLFQSMFVVDVQSSVKIRFNPFNRFNNRFDLPER